MAYAIMRCEKISAKGNLASSISHAYRERETLNADLDRTPENEILVRYDKEQTDNEIELARTRKDNVIMYDMFIGMSPEWAKDVSPAQVSEWKDKSMEWLKEEFGAENIKSAVLHQDEQTPHIQAHVIPRHEGKLNAKHWTGGKQRCSELQDRYHAKVKELGLARGERGSKARHEEVSKYYTRVHEPIEKKVKLTYPHPEMTDRLKIDDYGKKVAVSVRDQMSEQIHELRAKVKELQRPNFQNERKLYEEQSKKIKELSADLNHFKKQAVFLKTQGDKMVKSKETAMQKEINLWKDKAESMETAVKLTLPQEEQKKVIQKREELRREKVRTKERSIGLER